MVLFVGVITVVLLMAAVVVDLGLWLAERRGAQRAADLASAAAAQDLLVSDSDALASAYTWAEKNGYPPGEVTVELLCYNDLASAAICDNPAPEAGPVACSVGEICDSLRVRVSRGSTMLFSNLFGIDAFDIEAESSAGLTVQSVPTDTVILLDATGSMAFGCNATQDNPGCPMQEGRTAANLVVEMLLGGLNTESQVAYTPYQTCYNPPGPPDNPLAGCITPTNIVGLTTNTGGLHTAIDSTTAAGGTNLCLGLDKAAELINGAGAQAGARRNVILLSDGEGRLFYPDGSAYPPAACRPPGNIGEPGCGSSSEANEAAQDVKTLQRAAALKGQAVDIYVVALLLCGPEDGQAASPSYCAGVGNSDPDSIADQRLLKCVATSPGHYVKIDSASEIPDAFREIAAAIVSRGLLE